MDEFDNFALHFPNMRVGRFTLKANEKIPLHIHRNQFGLAYILQGVCEVTAYNIESSDDNGVILQYEGKSRYTAHEYCVLTPIINAHAIEIIEDCTFLDIFAPGKESGILSEFLKVISSENNENRLFTETISMDEAGLPKSLIDNATNHMTISETGFN